MSNYVTIVCLSLAFLATLVHADFKAFEARLNGMAVSGELVAGEFRPYKDGCVNHGVSGFVCNGERVFDEKPVMLKFVRSKESSEREYTMYSYLQAMEKPDTLEKYGFADVYFYAEWEGYYLLALSHFDGGYVCSESNKKFLKSDVGKDTINGLILFRNFVRQSKYMHSHGIRHNDITPQNIMLHHMNQSFLINFNCGTRMYLDNRCGMPKYAARAYHTGRIRTAVDEWENFLFTMCYLYGVDLYWFSHDMADADYFKYKNMPEIIITAINKSIKAFHLRHVFVEFANEVFNKEHTVPYPDYDHFEKLINNQIKNLVKPLQFEMFSWIHPERQFVEADKIFSKPKFNIEKDIKFPKSLDFKTYKYPPVNMKYFTEVNFAKSVSVMLRSCVEGSIPGYKNLKTHSLK